MWNMATDMSDVDLFVCNAINSNDLLMGEQYKSEFTTYEQLDIAYHESSKVVGQLKKSNINFVLGVISPIVITTSDFHKHLYEFLDYNRTKEIYHSIYGMVSSNLNKYYDEIAQDKSGTRINKLNRYVEFGKRWIQEVELSKIFKDIPKISSIDGLNTSLFDFTDIRNRSKLDEKYSKTELELLDWYLLTERKQFLSSS